jgi:hypothetical protein
MEAMLGISLYCLCFLFNKIRDKHRTDSAWSEGVGGRGRGRGIGVRNGPNDVCAHVNKPIIKKEYYSQTAL